MSAQRAISCAVLLTLINGCAGAEVPGEVDAGIAAQSTAPSTTAAGARVFALATDIARRAPDLEAHLASDAALVPRGESLAHDGPLAIEVSREGAWSFGPSSDMRVTLSLAFARGRPELHEGRAVRADVLPSTDEIVVAEAHRVEELLVLRDASAPKKFSFHLVRSAELVAPEREPDGALVFRDRAGVGVVRIPRAFAVDSAGVRRDAVIEVDGESLVVTLDTEGLTYPVLLDPAGESYLWGAGAKLPSPRYQSGAAWDTSRNVVVAFGGCVGGPTCSTSNELVEWNGAAWTTKCTGAPCTSSVPAARRYPSVSSFGPGKVLAYGGYSGPDFNDFWTWDGAAWAQLCDGTASCAGSVTARNAAAIAFDSARNEAVLFGGSVAGASNDETHVLSTAPSSKWVAKCTGACTRPPPRMYSAMAYDSKRGRVVMFGGFASATGLGLSDTWEWNGATATWTAVCTSCVAGTSKPDARRRHVMAYDSYRGVTVLTGGQSDASAALSDTWEWDGTTWTKTVAAPANEYLSAGAFDVSRRRVVLLGGYDGATVADATSLYHARGAACSTAATCDTTVCEDGRCCEVSCGPCQRCDKPGSEGLCTTAPDGEDNPGCFGASYCQAGVCKAKSALGAACTAGYQCTSGNCVDGVCCNTACTGLCQSCKSADTGGSDGTCANVKAGLSTGECTASAASTCGNDGACDGAGACRKWSSSTTCVAASCVSATAQKNASMCDGSGACVAGATIACGAGYACVGTACKSSCATDAHCAAGFYCDGTTCSAKKSNGEACAGGNQCSSGNCPAADGVCCDTACTGVCESCKGSKKGSGADGACGAIPDGADPDMECPDGPAGSCLADGFCNGARACRSFAPTGTPCGATTCLDGVQKGQSCNGTGSCVTAGGEVSCTPYKCADDKVCAKKCSVDGDCATGHYCDGLGLCQAKKGNGDDCGKAGECTSGQCVDGVCCNSACAGQCEACNEPASLGTCTAIEGPPHLGKKACNGDAGSPCAGKCDGKNGAACTYPTVECSSSCSGTQETIGTCDGTGGCVAGTAHACASGNSCDPATKKCRSTCTVDTDCADGYRCQGAACTPKGARCSDDGLSVIEADGTTVRPCSPYRCTGGRCGESCTDSTVCQDGFVCGEQKTCVAAPTGGTDADGGCATSRAPARAPFTLAVLALLGAGLRLRRRGST